MCIWRKIVNTKFNPGIFDEFISTCSKWAIDNGIKFLGLILDKYVEDFTIINHQPIILNMGIILCSHFYFFYRAST